MLCLNKCIIVLGIPRSGTSLVAGILHRLNVNMGNQLLNAGPSNPKGFYEDLEFLKLHQLMIGNVWHDPDMSNIDRYLSEYELLIRKKENQSLWGIKDPRLCFLLKYLLNIIKCDTKLILTERPLHESANSMLADRFISNRHHSFVNKFEYAMKVCNRYEASKYDLVQKSRLPFITVKFHDLFDDTSREINKICEFVGLDCDAHDQIDFVDSSLRHFHDKT
jgi:hypothetical protein